jgi:DNA-binding ferritin-like protein (Dps family)
VVEIMSRHGKYKLFLLAGLSILLVVSSLVMFADGRNHSNDMWVILSITICLSVAVVIVVSISLKKRQARIGSLPKGYRDAFMDIQELIGLSTIRQGDKTRIAEMVLEIFEHAALKGRTVQEVTGGDLKQFLDGFFKAAGGESSLLYSLLYSSALFSGFLLSIKTYKVFRHGRFSTGALQTEVLDLGIVMTYALISFVFFPWMKSVLRKAAKEQWQGWERGRLLLPFIVPFGSMAILIGVEADLLRAFLDQPFPVLGSLYLYFLWLALLAGSLLGMNFVQKWQFRKNLDN